MRVMLLVTDLEPGGTPLRITRLALGLRAHGVEVVAGCLAPRGPLHAELERGGVATFACDARGPTDFAALGRLARHVRTFRPHVLHATLFHANVAARVVGLWQRVPVLTATATIEVERRWHVWLERLTARVDRGHLVHSVSLAEHVVRAFCLPRGHVRIVPPGLARPPTRLPRDAARAALAIPPHEFAVAWVGRFDPVKRWDVLLGVAEILTRIPARFLLVGDGPDRRSCERALRLSSAAHTVHLLGWRQDVGAVLSAADAFLFPSLTEGMPNAVLEAMACGLPVVAHDIPPLREIAGPALARREPVEPEPAGPPLTGPEQRLMLVAGEQPRDYADALLALHADAGARVALGARAAAWAREHLDFENTIRATLAVYRRIRHEGRAAAGV